jgi:micrococcal nuclease
MKYEVVIYLFFLAILFSCGSKSKQKNKIRNQYLLVTKIVDGDTFWADNGSEKGVKVRFIGIDAPESRNMFKIKKEYFGKDAKKYLSELLSGKSVKLISDVDSLDRYGRTLSYVYLKDGTFVNAEIIKNGFAVIMTIPPNVKYADEFLKLQQEARENKRGLWKEE